MYDNETIHHYLKLLIKDVQLVANKFDGAGCYKEDEEDKPLTSMEVLIIRLATSRYFHESAMRMTHYMMKPFPVKDIHITNEFESQRSWMKTFREP